MRWAAALLLPLALVGCTSAPPTPTSAPSAPGGFRAAVSTTYDPAAGPHGAGKLAWRSTWRLTWEPVPGADEYVVHRATSEGQAAGTARVVDRPALELEAAAGTSPTSLLERDRRAGLLLTSSQLLVSVSARRDGQEGPRSAWFAVGDEPTDGVPLPHGGSGGHAGHGEHSEGSSESSPS